MPNFTTDESPFSVRRRPGKRQEEVNKGHNAGPSTKSPSITGQASTSSTASSENRYSKFFQNETSTLSIIFAKIVFALLYFCGIELLSKY